MLLALVVGLLFAARLYELILKILNLYSLEQWQHSASGDDVQQRYGYQKALQLYSLSRSAVGTVAFLLFLVLRLPAWLFQQVQILLAAVGLHSPLWHGILFLAVLQLTQLALQLSWGLYRRFVIEERYGFNCMSPRDYAKDLLRTALLGLVLGLPLLLLLFWLVQNLKLWWLWGFLSLTGYQILLFWLYPVFIAPLFNRFSPLDEDGAEDGKQGQLKRRLEQLLQQCQFAAKGLFVMDGSKRSRHSNAYFTGFGKSRRIVLFDTLLDDLQTEQLAAVLAHEIGHYKKKHIPKNLAQGILVLFCTFLGLYLLAQWQALFLSFGFPAAAEAGSGLNPALLFFVGLVLAEPLGLILQRLGNHFSRRHEFEADAYAAQVMGSPHDLGEALQALHRENLSNPAPHPRFAALYYSHPALPERLAALGYVGEPQIH